MTAPTRFFGADRYGAHSRMHHITSHSPRRLSGVDSEFLTMCGVFVCSVDVDVGEVHQLRDALRMGIAWVWSDPWRAGPWVCLVRCAPVAWVKSARLAMFVFLNGGPCTHALRCF